MRISHYKKILFLIIATCTHLNASIDPLTDIAQKLIAALNSLSSISSGEIALSVELITGPTFELVSTMLPPLSDSEIATLCRYISTEYAPEAMTAVSSNSNKLTQQLKNIENTLKTLKTHAESAITFPLSQEQLPATLLVMGTLLAHITYNTNINNATQRNNCAKHVIRLINLLDFIASNWNIPATSLGTTQSKVHTSLKNNGSSNRSTWYVTSSSTSGNWTYSNGRATTAWLQSITQLALNYCATIMGIKSANSLTTPRTFNYSMTIDQTGRLFCCNMTNPKIYRVNNDSTITEFATQGATRDAVCTADNSIWFTQYGNRIGKIASDGTLTQYTPNTNGLAGPWFNEMTIKFEGITIGPDNNLWFCDRQYHRIGKITESGTSTMYQLQTTIGPRHIITGPDGNLWFTGSEDNTINVMDTNGQLLASYSAQGKPWSICVGADNNLWYTCPDENTIHKITALGVITKYTLQEFVGPVVIKPGWDGNLWFTGQHDITLGRITPLGVITFFWQPKLSSFGMTQGPDNKLWISGLSTARIDSLQI